MTKKRSDSRKRERQPQTFEQKLRNKLTRTFVPFTAQRAMFDVAASLAQYETATDAVWGKQDGKAGIELLGSLQTQGVFDEQFLQKFELAAEALSTAREAIIDSATQKLDRQLGQVPPERLPNIDKINKGIDKDLDAIQVFIMEEKRPLLLMMFREMILRMRQVQIEREITQFGTYETLKHHREAMEAKRVDPTVARTYLWYQFAHDCSQQVQGNPQAIPQPAELAPEKIHEWLNDVELSATGSHVEYFRFRTLRHGINSMYGRLHLLRDLHPFSLSGFDFGVSGRPPIAPGEISRITGELSMNDYFITSLRRPFEFFGIPEVYERLKDELLVAVYHRYEREQLNDDTKTALRDLLARVEAGTVKASDTAFEAEVDDLLTIEDSEDEEDSSTLIFEEKPAVVVTPKKPEIEKKQKPRRIRRLTARRITNALLRCKGVTLTTTRGDHPHFEKSGRVERFFNQHGGQEMSSGRYLGTITRICRNLQIDPDEFWDNLK